MNKDMTKIYTSIEVIKEQLNRMEIQNNKDHEEIKKKQDLTNGRVRINDRRIQKLEDYKLYHNKTHQEDLENYRFNFTKNEKLIALGILLAQFIFNVVVFLKFQIMN